MIHHTRNMKKRGLFRVISHHVKRLRYRYEMLKAGPAFYQVDLGKKR
jgi:hypothetical protein